MPDIWRFAVLALFAVTILLGANAAYASPDATVLESVDNERLTVNYSVDSSVDGAQYARSYLDNETIVEADNGNTLEDGVDYEWDTTTGNVTWYDTAETDPGENVTINYTYWRPTDGTRLTAGIMGIFGGLLGVLLLVVGVGAMWNISGGGGL